MKCIGLFAIFICFASCQNQNQEINITASDYHAAVDKVTEVMVHDIFSPPVASRIYNYANIAAYEVICQEENEYNSLQSQLHGLNSIPKAGDGKQINYAMASLVAYLEIGKNLIFSEDKINVYQDSLYASWQTKNKTVFQDSKAYGNQVAEHIKSWYSSDNYAQTRTMPKFSVNTEDPSRWQPTPPDYMDGIEPHWSKIRPSIIDSSAQFKPARYPDFSLEKESAFYKELLETYEVGETIKKEGEESEKLEIAQFWDCNPYVSTHKGHLMFATKKITPGAHWIGICKIACEKTNADFSKTVFAYTKTSIAIADAFISCWDEKYRSNLIRPETLINQHIDENWEPVLQTPPFPEYTSGHSVVSGAASTVLTSIFGDNFEFNDDTELRYGLPIRSFNSFNQAADEAAISRLYGGIHYRAAIDLGLDQGRSLGSFVVKKLQMKKSN
ncbi:phosphatase PAP2 family protein [Aquimarina sp. AD10]|uniref:vanadium-dependent haloperoxidase n=1 Tax=Aquimarina sp. AD10 TaxID=1714849 RepID=UPI000E4E370D|nr:vanadium-dependent haloperoxidase [Aquimarina sp. AD10]AXT63724.1 phosphatase PAP2 family protein [Aquimarina sp. AD10]RKM97795.1 phosphatase PAP2 family protein [Aquimarina sp. AD10]